MFLYTGTFRQGMGEWRPFYKKEYVTAKAVPGGISKTGQGWMQVVTTSGGGSVAADITLPSPVNSLQLSAWIFTPNEQNAVNLDGNLALWDLDRNQNGNTNFVAIPGAEDWTQVVTGRDGYASGPIKRVRCEIYVMTTNQRLYVSGVLLV
jgi:hypothetical protein